jgi:hypothetical protein
MVLDLGGRFRWNVIGNLIPIANAQAGNALDQKKLLFGIPVLTDQRRGWGMHKVEAVAQPMCCRFSRIG